MSDMPPQDPQTTDPSQPTATSEHAERSSAEARKQRAGRQFGIASMVLGGAGWLGSFGLSALIAYLKRGGNVNDKMLHDLYGAQELCIPLLLFGFVLGALGFFRYRARAAKVGLLVVVAPFILVLIANGVILSGLPAAGKGGTGEWIKFTPDDGRFEVLLPGRPRHEQQSRDMFGKEQQSHAFRTETRDQKSFLAVQYHTLPREVETSEEARQRLESLQTHFVQSVGGNLLRESEIELQGYPGREFYCKVVMDGRPSVWAMRIFLVRARLYELNVLTQGNDDRDESAERLFRSFRLAEPSTLERQ
jgi:hypothetical protein